MRVATEEFFLLCIFAVA